MITLAAASKADSTPGLFVLTWGLFASIFGLAAVTNFRGFADNFTRRGSGSRLRKVPPWKLMPPPDPQFQVRLMRVIAVPFAVAGPIVFLIGLIQIAQGHTGLGPTTPMGSFGYAFMAIAVVSATTPWVSRQGMFRIAARSGGWRLAVALLASLGTLAFGMCLARGQMTLGFSIAVFAVVPAMLLMLDGKPAGGPAEPDSAGQPPQGGGTG